MVPFLWVFGDARFLPVGRSQAGDHRLTSTTSGTTSGLGYKAVIVADEPSLRGAFDPESKVTSYIEASDAFVALCTNDDRVPGNTAQNIIDEIGRARSHPSLREVVCVLKEAAVRLPSNINPVWDALRADQPETAFGVIRRQLDAWGVAPTLHRGIPPPEGSLPPAFLDDLFDGVEIGDHEKAESKLFGLFIQLPKHDQRRVVQGIFDYAVSPPPDHVEMHVVGSFLEAANRIDSGLVSLSLSSS